MEPEGSLTHSWAWSLQSMSPHLTLDMFVCLFVFGATARVSSFARFLDHTQRHVTVGRSPLNEWSARRRDFYLTTHNTRNRQHIHAHGGIRTHNLSRRATTLTGTLCKSYVEIMRYRNIRSLTEMRREMWRDCCRLIFLRFLYKTVLWLTKKVTYVWRDIVTHSNVADNATSILKAWYNFARRKRFYGDLVSSATIKRTWGLGVKCPIFVTHSDQIWVFSTDFHKRHEEGNDAVRDYVRAKNDRLIIQREGT